MVALFFVQWGFLPTRTLKNCKLAGGCLPDPMTYPTCGHEPAFEMPEKVFGSLRAHTPSLRTQSESSNSHRCMKTIRGPPSWVLIVQDPVQVYGGDLFGLCVGWGVKNCAIRVTSYMCSMSQWENLVIFQQVKTHEDGFIALCTDLSIHAPPEMYVEGL